MLHQTKLLILTNSNICLAFLRKYFQLCRSKLQNAVFEHLEPFFFDLTVAAKLFSKMLPMTNFLFD